MSVSQMTTPNPMSWFFTPTRGKNDVTQKDYEIRDNAAQQSYYMNSAPNQAASSCQDFEPKADWASQFVTLNYTGNYGNTAAGGCDTDLYSRLILGDEGTQRQKGHQQTFARPWATTPNLGGGPSAASKDTESQLIQSIPVRTPKECSTVTDKFFSTQFDPQLPSVQQEMKSVNNFVQTWARGGDPTRIAYKKIVQS